MADDGLPAVIDVGTNTIKLVVARPDLSESLYERTIAARIGEGMDANGGRIGDIPLERGIDALKALAEEAREQGAAQVIAVGTAALRDAPNGREFAERARREARVDIEIISGEEEARLSFLAITRDTRWRSLPQLGVVDIGGGSTEVVIGDSRANAPQSRVSVPLGAVRVTERYLTSDPPSKGETERARAAIAGALEAAGSAAERPHLVGVGGTITNLANMARGAAIGLPSLHGSSLSRRELETQIDLLCRSSVADRQQIPGLDPRRADIILGGALLLAAVMDRFSQQSVDVSLRGLRWGVLHDRFEAGPDAAP